MKEHVEGADHRISSDFTFFSIYLPPSKDSLLAWRCLVGGDQCSSIILLTKEELVAHMDKHGGKFFRKQLDNPEKSHKMCERICRICMEKAEELESHGCKLENFAQLEEVPMHEEEEEGTRQERSASSPCPVVEMPGTFPGKALSFPTKSSTADLNQQVEELLNRSRELPQKNLEDKMEAVRKSRKDLEMGKKQRKKRREQSSSSSSSSSDSSSSSSSSEERVRKKNKTQSETKHCSASKMNDRTPSKNSKILQEIADLEKRIKVKEAKSSPRNISQEASANKQLKIAQLSKSVDLTPEQHPKQNKKSLHVHSSCLPAGTSEALSNSIPAVPLRTAGAQSREKPVSGFVQSFRPLPVQGNPDHDEAKIVEESELSSRLTRVEEKAEQLDLEMVKLSAPGMEVSVRISESKSAGEKLMLLQETLDGIPLDGNMLELNTRRKNAADRINSMAARVSSLLDTNDSNTLPSPSPSPPSSTKSLAPSSSVPCSKRAVCNFCIGAKITSKEQLEVHLTQEHRQEMFECMVGQCGTLESKAKMLLSHLSYIHSMPSKIEYLEKC